MREGERERREWRKAVRRSASSACVHHWPRLLAAIAGRAHAVIAAAVVAGATVAGANVAGATVAATAGSRPRELLRIRAILILTRTIGAASGQRHRWSTRYGPCVISCADLASPKARAARRAACERTHTCARAQARSHTSVQECPARAPCTARTHLAYGREEAALARVWEANEANVRNGLELELEEAHLAAAAINGGSAAARTSRTKSRARRSASELPPPAPPVPLHPLQQAPLLRPASALAIIASGARGQRRGRSSEGRCARPSPSASAKRASGDGKRAAAPGGGEAGAESEPGGDSASPPHSRCVACFRRRDPPKRIQKICGVFRSAKKGTVSLSFFQFLFRYFGPAAVLLSSSRTVSLHLAKYGRSPPTFYQ